MNFNVISLYKKECMKKIVILALFFTTATQAAWGPLSKLQKNLQSAYQKWHEGPGLTIDNTLVVKPTKIIAQQVPTIITEHPLKSAAALLIIGDRKILSHLVQNNPAASLVGAGSFAFTYHYRTQWNPAGIYTAAAVGALAGPLAYKTATATASLAQKTGNFIAANARGTFIGAVAGFMVGSHLAQEYINPPKKPAFKTFFAITGGLTGAAFSSYFAS